MEDDCSQIRAADSREDEVPSVSDGNSESFPCRSWKKWQENIISAAARRKSQLKTHFKKRANPHFILLKTTTGAFECLRKQQRSVGGSPSMLVVNLCRFIHTEEEAE